MKNKNKKTDLHNEYEELLMKRDQMYKDGDSYQIAYKCEFGELINKNFELKIECIRRKKTIAACKRRMNRGIAIDVREMMIDIEKEMTAYHDRLKEMSEETAAVKEAEFVDGFDDIEERIERLEMQICEIATTEPYFYGALLADEEKKNALKETLEEERADYESYIRQLDTELEKLIGKEGVNLV